MASCEILTKVEASMNNNCGGRQVLPDRCDTWTTKVVLKHSQISHQEDQEQTVESSGVEIKNRLAGSRNGAWEGCRQIAASAVLAQPWLQMAVRS